MKMIEERLKTLVDDVLLENFATVPIPLKIALKEIRAFELIPWYPVHPENFVQIRPYILCSVQLGRTVQIQWLIQPVARMALSVILQKQTKTVLRDIFAIVMKFSLRSKVSKFPKSSYIVLKYLKTFEAMRRWYLQSRFQ